MNDERCTINNNRPCTINTKQEMGYICPSFTGGDSTNLNSSLAILSTLRASLTVDQNTPGMQPLSEPSSGITLAMMILSLELGVDTSIIGVATPRITETYHSLDDVVWYGSTYLLPCTVSQPYFGWFYKLSNVTYVYLNQSVFRGERRFPLVHSAGYALFAAASTSILFILGRMVSGCGAEILQRALSTVNRSATQAGNHVLDSKCAAIQQNVCTSVLLAQSSRTRCHQQPPSETYSGYPKQIMNTALFLHSLDTELFQGLRRPHALPSIHQERRNRRSRKAQESQHSKTPSPVDLLDQRRTR